jgi:hypothetical protein
MFSFAAIDARPLEISANHRAQHRRALGKEKPPLECRPPDGSCVAALFPPCAVSGTVLASCSRRKSSAGAGSQSFAYEPAASRQRTTRAARLTRCFQVDSAIRGSTLFRQLTEFRIKRCLAPDS